MTDEQEGEIARRAQYAAESAARTKVVRAYLTKHARKLHMEDGSYRGLFVPFIEDESTYGASAVRVGLQEMVMSQHGGNLRFIGWDGDQLALEGWSPHPSDYQPLGVAILADKKTTDEIISRIEEFDRGA